MKRIINFAEYTDKIKACYMGKYIGCLAGSFYGIRKFFEEVSPENISFSDNISSEYIDMEIGSLEVLEEKGCEISALDIADIRGDRVRNNNEAYNCFLANYQKGIDPPLSGKFGNVFFCEDVSSLARSEIWGMVCPGNYSLAAALAKADAETDHTGEAVAAEMFWSAAISEAFFTDSPEEIINAGMAVIEKDSDTEQIIYDVFMVYERCNTLKEGWITLIRTWGERNSVGVRINFAFALLSLLYGEGDFKNTLAAAVSLGGDVSAVASLVLSVLCAANGSGIIPEEFADKTVYISDINTEIHKECSFSSLALDTALAGTEFMIGRNTLTDILDIPEDIYEKACNNYYSRNINKPLEVSVSYETGDSVPAFIEGKAYAELVIRNNTKRQITGIAKIEAEDSDYLDVCFSENMSDSQEFAAEALSEEKIPLVCSLKSYSNVAWQKNLLCATVEAEDEIYEKIFGFSGSSHWNVYGPYWDLEEEGKNHRKTCDINKEYLNEKVLLDFEMEEEFPFKVECSESLMTREDISYNLGEACYYFTREILCERDEKTFVRIGIAEPFVLYVNGKKYCENQKKTLCQPCDNLIEFDMETGEEYRFVIKALVTDDFRFSFDFIKRNTTEKCFGESIILDCYGDKI